MKKNVVLLKFVKKISFLFFLALIFSCQIGLGEKVDVYAPTVKVFNPIHTGYVLKTFQINGTATDDTAITKLELKIEPLDNPTPETTFKYRVVDNVWEKYSSSNGLWERVETNGNDEFIYAKGSKKEIKWSLAFEMPQTIQNGTEFSISTQAFDYYGNESSNSKDERSVIVDTTEPKVSIISPSIIKSYTTIENSYQKYKLNDNSILANLINGKFTVKGSQKEDGRLSKLIVYLDEKTDNSIENISSGNVVARKEVTGDNLRNWETSFDLSDFTNDTYKEGKHLLRLVTQSYDQAGNCSTEFHGWFVYWNEADKPWCVCSFGGEKPDSKIGVYPNSSLQGQAYDDDGIKSIEINVYNSDGSKVDSNSVLLDLSSENNPKYKAWSVNALNNNCDFYVTVKCTDVNGISSETLTRYLQVQDVNPPKIKFNEVDRNGNIDIPGNKDKKITVSGYVTDDGTVQSIQLVRIKSGTDASVMLKYYDSNYEEWKKALNKDSYKDSNGNMIWNITGSLDSSYNDIGTKQKFEKEFLLDDIGINGSTEMFNTQTFIIKATDNGENSSIDTFSFAGDTKAPVLNVTALYVDGNCLIDYTNNDVEKKISPFEKNSTGKVSNKIKLKGTWSDNSYGLWGGTPTIKIIFNEDDTFFTVYPKEDGTWETNEKTGFPDFTTAIFSVEFSDLGGNIAKVNENFFVNSDNPRLLRITAKENDGSFKEGEKINLVLEFNKAVKYNKEQPTIKLNTGETVNFSSGNTTSEHIFTYTVKEGINEDKLDVTEIFGNWVSADSNEFNVENMNPNSNEVSVLFGANPSNSLAGSKTLCIDTKSPKIEDFTCVTQKGYYNKGDKILIKAEFDEPVSFDDPDSIKLKLPDGVYTESSPISIGDKTLLFTYIVGDNQNYNPLKIINVEIEDEELIHDIAGNSLDIANSVKSKTFDGVVIDTTSPQKPVITIKENGNKATKKVFYDQNSEIQLVIEYDEGATVKEYSTDGGSTWNNYTSEVTLGNGEYTIKARSKDAADNSSESDYSNYVKVDKRVILTSVSVDKPTGSYTNGETFIFALNFSIFVEVSSDSKIKLNLTDAAASLYGTYSKPVKKIEYKYTVPKEGTGYNCDILKIESISGTFKDSNENDISKYCVKVPNQLEDVGTKISIVTNKPVISSCDESVSGNSISFKFNRSIYKGKGDITITHGEGYRAPLVISVDEFNRIGNDDLKTYYELGTNGSDEAGNADLTEKWILKYDYDNTDEDLINILKGTTAYKFTIPIKSSNVVISKDKLTIKFDENLKLPVRGASYTVLFPEEIVKDILNNENVEETKDFSYGGCKTPVIRVQKARETILGYGSGAIVTQPKSVEFKVGCQTPNTTPSVSVWKGTNEKDNFDGDKIKKITEKNPNLVEDTAAAKNKKLGNDNDIEKGFIYKIIASVDSTSTVAYEYAYRTVYTLTNPPGGDVGNNYTHCWLRGGDWDNGGNSVSTFPISWNTKEFDKVRAMTKKDNNWYFISWEINKTAYTMPLRGDMPEDASVKGPSIWTWGMQGPVPLGSDKYKLFPGHSLSISGTQDYKYGAMSFYQKHAEYRTKKDEVKKEYKTESQL